MLVGRRASGVAGTAPQYLALRAQLLQPAVRGLAARDLAPRLLPREPQPLAPAPSGRFPSSLLLDKYRGGMGKSQSKCTDSRRAAGTAPPGGDEGAEAAAVVEERGLVDHPAAQVQQRHVGAEALAQGDGESRLAAGGDAPVSTLGWLRSTYMWRR